MRAQIESALADAILRNGLTAAHARTIELQAAALLGKVAHLNPEAVLAILLSALAQQLALGELDEVCEDRDTANGLIAEPDPLQERIDALTRRVCDETEPYADTIAALRAEVARLTLMRTNDGCGTCQTCGRS